MAVVPEVAESLGLHPIEDGCRKEEETHVSELSGNNCHGKDGSTSAADGEVAVVDGADMTQAMEKWELQLATKTPSTRECYRRHVRRLLEVCGKRSPNRISDEDVSKYLNTLKSRSSQDQALAAIKAFMKICGRTIHDVPLRTRTPPVPIQEITDEQVKSMIDAVQDLQEKALILTLRDTGGRISAICNLEIDDFRNDHIILRSELAKNKVQAMAPITEEASRTIREHLMKNRPQRYIFEREPSKPLTRGKAWKIIRKAARSARIEKRVYPHLFRHMRALAYRRAETEPDVVVNAMGWTDTTQYNKRYGKRTAIETLEEARKVLNNQVIATDSTLVVDRLTSLLENGKIDLQTYRAGLQTLGELKKKPETDLTGYL